MKKSQFYIFVGTALKWHEIQEGSIVVMGILLSPSKMCIKLRTT
jgi:hypothetical protein